MIVLDNLEQLLSCCSELSLLLERAPRLRLIGLVQQALSEEDFRCAWEKGFATPIIDALRSTRAQYAPT